MFQWVKDSTDEVGLDSFFLFLFLVGGDVENDAAVESSAGADSEVVAKSMKVGFCDVVSSHFVTIVSRFELFSGSCG